jgi:hypothetical protein
LSGAECLHLEQCGFDIRWRLGFQVSDNERHEYTSLITGFQIGSKVFPNEIWFYEMKLKLQPFTGFKGLIRKI